MYTIEIGLLPPDRRQPARAAGAFAGLVFLQLLIAHGNTASSTCSRSLPPAPRRRDAHAPLPAPSVDAVLDTHSRTAGPLRPRRGACSPRSSPSSPARRCSTAPGLDLAGTEGLPCRSSRSRTRSRLPQPERLRPLPRHDGQRLEIEIRSDDGADVEDVRLRSRAGSTRAPGPRRTCRGSTGRCGSPSPDRAEPVGRAPRRADLEGRRRSWRSPARILSGQAAAPRPRCSSTTASRPQERAETGAWWSRTEAGVPGARSLPTGVGSCGTSRPRLAPLAQPQEKELT
jgi:hypothetical protein